MKADGHVWHNIGNQGVDSSPLSSVCVSNYAGPPLQYPGLGGHRTDPVTCPDFGTAREFYTAQVSYRVIQVSRRGNLPTQLTGMFGTRVVESTTIPTVEGCLVT